MPAREGPTRYVELIRVSSAGQLRADTPEDQRKALDGLRRSRPGILVARIEEQVSGAKGLEDRPDLKKLASLAASRAFDELRVRHLDRLTRHADPGERSAILAMVYRAGAVIVDAGGTVLDPRTMAGELVWVVQTLGAAEERRKIAERTMAGKRRRAQEGRLVHGTPPWGRAFDAETGWALTDAAEDYRRLFDLALQGKTLSQIAESLTAEGIASCRNRPWTTGMVWNLLRADHASGRYRSHGAEMQVPAIVDEATQVEALARVKANDNAGGAHITIPALLRKILRCGVCGAPMHTNRNSRRPGKPPLPPFYFCSSRGPCRVNHRIAEVDAAVKKMLREGLSRPARRVLEEGAAPESPDDPIAREKARQKLAAEEERLSRLAMKGTVSEDTAEKLLGEIRRKRLALSEDERMAKERARFLARQKDAAREIEARLSELRERIKAASFAEWREVVGIVFPRGTGYGVRIWPDGKIRLKAAVALGDAPSSSRTSWSISATN